MQHSPDRVVGGKQFEVEAHVCDACYRACLGFKKDEGKVAFEIPCVMTQRCNGTMLHVGILRWPYPPTHEWYKPSPKEVLLQPGKSRKDYFDAGGLNLRRMLKNSTDMRVEKAIHEALQRK